MGRRRRGAQPLAAVLLWAALLLVICLAIASGAILSLQFAASFTASTKASLLAQAAVVQFIAEMDAADAAAPRTLTETTPITGSPLLERYRSRPVFPKSAQNLEGEATITFDSTLDHFSVDNSNSENPAAGWVDVGTLNRSVPPFTISLVIKTRVQGQVRSFEALLRRRWPYAVATLDGPIQLLNTVEPVQVGGFFDARAATPTLVEGDVLAMQGVNLVGDRPQLPTPAESSGLGIQSFFSYTAEGPDGSKRKVAMEKGLRAQASDNVIPEDAKATVTIGSSALVESGRVRAAAPPGKTGKLFINRRAVPGTGNRLVGRIDIGSEKGTVDVRPGNFHDGTVRKGIPFNRNPLSSIVIDTDGMTEVPFPDDELPDDVFSMKFIDRNGRPIFHPLRQSLILGPEAPERPGALTFSQSTRFIINASAGNRYPVATKKELDANDTGPFDIEIFGGPKVKPSPKPFEVTLQTEADKPTLKGEMRVSPASIELRNCMLLVNGDLDLGSSLGEGGGQQPKLTGTNATLIVNGTLTLDDAVLDARDQAMVIFARRIVSRAAGDYRGLIVAEQSALFFPLQSSRDRLRVQGGILCGGGTAQNTEGDEIRAGLALFGADVVFDPRFLKTLHGFGRFTLQTLRPVP